MTTTPDVNYTARDFTTIKPELLGVIQGLAPDLFTDFNDSALGVALVDLVSYVGDLTSHGLDVLAQELYLSTARRAEGPLRFARDVGYVPVSARGAQVTVQGQAVPQQVVLNGATIPAGTFIRGTNGLNYELVEDFIVAPGTSVLTLTLREGTTFTDTYQPTKSASQEFTVSQGGVEQDSWQVFVGSTADPSNLWTQVANVSFEQTPSQTYEVFTDGDGGLTIVFGDGNSGAIPNQTVSVVYRTTNGAAGNAAASTIRGSVQANVTGGAGSVSIAVANTTVPATGGTDREGVDDLRRSIPAFIRTLDQVRTIADYQDLTANLGGVALVFADVPLSSFSGNIVRVHVWDVEAIDFAATSPESGISSAVNYDRYAQVPSNRVFAVQQYLAPRTVASVHNVVVRPTIANVDLFLGRVAYDSSRFDAQTVHTGIVRAVVELFENSSGFIIRIADIYDQVLAVPGVRYFTVERILFERIDPDNAPSTITEEFRTDQDTDGSEGGPYNPLQDLVIPGTDGRVYYDDTFLFDNEVTYGTAVDNPNVQAINLRTLTFDLQASS